MRDEANPVQSSFLTGRISLLSVGAKLELVIDGRAQPLILLGRQREFSIPLPSFVFDGAAHEICARLAWQTEWLHGCPLHFQSKYQGYVHMEPFSGALLTGWAIDLSRPSTVLYVELLLHGRAVAAIPANIFRQDLISIPQFSGVCGFSHKIEGEEELEKSAVIQARILGTHFDLHGSPVLYLDTSRLLKTVHSVNAAFRFLSERTLSRQPGGPGIDLDENERRTFCDLFLESGNIAEMLELSRWFQTAGGQHIAAATHRHRYYTYMSETFAGASTIRRPSVTNPCTDVIVYIDSFSERVSEGLRRLLLSLAEPAFQVICVIEAELAASGEFLEQIGAGHGVLLIQNQGHLGFAASVNQAAAVHPDRDIVLLNPETFVAANWLERLRWTALNTPAAGIVTPFASDGEVCCYYAASDRGIAAEIPSLNDLCGDVNARRTIDLPAVHGACTYIRRACIDEVGALETVAFRTRHPAVVDFCLRAASRGWRILLAADSLVESPPSQVEPEADRNALNLCHPYYGDLLVNFQVDDPARQCCREIDLAVIRNLKRPVFCFLTHRFGGGTERHVRDLCAALDKSGIESVVIFALDSSRVALEIPRLHALASLHYKIGSEFEKLVGDLSKLDIRHFHIHSNIAIPNQLFTLPDRLGVSYDCTIHDYLWFCPRVNLIDGSGLYCGEPPAAVCDVCIRIEGSGLWREFSSTHKNVAELRDESQDLLSRARTVFCPSQDTKLRMARQFQLDNLVVRRNLKRPPAHPVSLIPESALTVVGVALVGFISRKKGMDILLECARAAERDGLPLRFVVVGFTEDDGAFRGLSNVLITGRYEEGGAGTLIRAHRLRLALFPIVWPETYSYTLSIALNCGLYPVAFDLGAISERIREIRFGHLLPLESSPQEINAALIECSRIRKTKPPAGPQEGLLDVVKYYYPSVHDPARPRAPAGRHADSSHSSSAT